MNLNLKHERNIWLTFAEKIAVHKWGCRGVNFSARLQFYMYCKPRLQKQINK